MLALFLFAHFHKGKCQDRNPSCVHHLDSFFYSTASIDWVSLMEQNRKALSLERYLGQWTCPDSILSFLFLPGVIGTKMDLKQMFILDILKCFRESKKWLDYFVFCTRRHCFSNVFFNEKKIIMQDIWRWYRWYSFNLSALTTAIGTLWMTAEQTFDFNWISKVSLTPKD